MPPVTYETYLRWSLSFGLGLLTTLFAPLTGDLGMGSHGDEAAVFLLSFTGQDWQVDDIPLGTTQVLFETATIFKSDLDVEREAALPKGFLFFDVAEFT
jgi:hypothetical protein